MSLLHTPITLREVEFRNRAWVSPMCQYSSRDGAPTDWHLVHLGARATGGAGAVIVEASAVVPEGRISPDDSGIWSDEHVEAFRPITAFLSEHGAVPGIQIAHAGRKASVDAPWRGGRKLAPDEGGWQPVAPSALAYDDGWQVPHELTASEIEGVIEAFAAAARRALAAGFRLLEVHAAHGYLLHEFLSPLSNERSDRYGGDFEGRIRLPLEVVAAVREAWPAELPLSVRISASDWVDGGWSLDDSIALAQRLGPLGVDLVDCSSGGNSPAQQIALGPGYQVPFSVGHPPRGRHRHRRGRPDHRAAAGRGDPARGRRRRDPARPRVAARRILAAACRRRAGSRGRRLALAVPARAAAPDGACVLMALRLSVLDQSPIAEGGTGGQALRNSVDLAKLTDALGYSRYWVAEHHGMPMLASAAPEILIAEIAAVTERIRVGSGGVMLPHYSPFKVAETFSILGGLHGDRIDLGIGRAPGLRSGDDVRAAARPAPDVAGRLPRAAHGAARLRRERLPGRPPLRAARGAAGRAGQARRLAARLLAAERDLGRRARAPVLRRRLHQPERRRDRAALPRALRAVAAGERSPSSACASRRSAPTPTRRPGGSRPART